MASPYGQDYPILCQAESLLYANLQFKKTTNHSIAGKWEWMTVSYEFFNDDTYSYLNTETGLRTNGNYAISGNVITFFIGSVAKSEFSLQGDRLTLTIIIEMYYAPKEHNPPHIHVRYQGNKASVNIITCELIEGNMTVRHLRFVQAWIEIHRDELLANWDLCMSGKEPFKIQPLN